MPDNNAMNDNFMRDVTVTSGAMRDSAPDDAMHDGVSNDVVASIGMPNGAMRDAEPPVLPRPRMSRSRRAKIFIPFDPLKGYQEALREKEREAEAAFEAKTNAEAEVQAAASTRTEFKAAANAETIPDLISNPRSNSRNRRFFKL